MIICSGNVRVMVPFVSPLVVQWTWFGCVGISLGKLARSCEGIDMNLFRVGRTRFANWIYSECQVDGCAPVRQTLWCRFSLGLSSLLTVSSVWVWEGVMGSHVTGVYTPLGVWVNTHPPFMYPRYLTEDGSSTGEVRYCGEAL